MFQTKPTTIAIIVAKFSELDNVLVSVVVVVMTHNQVPKQHVLKKCESMKAKATTD